MKVPFAQDHSGMQVSATGLLDRRGNSQDLCFARAELANNLTAMAKRFYAGDLAAVDEFCQLYALADKERRAAKAAQG